MATTPQPPGGQPDGKPGEAETRERNPVQQIIKDSISLLAIISAILTLIVLVFTWTVLGTSDLVKLLGTIGLVTLVVAFTCVIGLKKTKQLSSVVIMASACIGIACICATAVVILLHRGATSPTVGVPSESAAIRGTTIKFDQRGTAANPVMVACQQVVPVSGLFPKGYNFAIGNVVMGSNAGIVFVPETAAITKNDNTYQVPVTFGDNSDAGRQFVTYLVVMPKQELNYLISSGQQTREIEAQQTLTNRAQKEAEEEAVEESWWTGAGLPPPPAFKADSQIYQRGPTKGGCPN